MADQWKVTTEYEDGSKESLETADGSRAMNMASSATWEDDQAKTVTLQKNNEVIWSEKIAARKDESGTAMG